MRRHRPAAVVACLVASTAIGCAPMAPEPTAAPSVRLATIATRDGVHLAGIGGASALELVLSEDGGTTWSIERPSGPAMTAIADLGGSRLLGSTACSTPANANGPSGPTPTSCLFASTDSGHSWTDLGVGRIVDPSFVDNTNGWGHAPIDGAVADGSFYASHDGGRSWSAIESPCPSDTPLISQAIETALDSGFVLCTALARSGPPPWALVEARPRAKPIVRASSSAGGFPGDSVTGIAFRDDGTGLLWSNQVVFRTNDGGRTLTQAFPALPSAGSFGRGVMVSDQVAILAATSIGNYAAVYATRDGGSSWSPLGSWAYDWGK